MALEIEGSNPSVHPILLSRHPQTKGAAPCPTKPLTDHIATSRSDKRGRHPHKTRRRSAATRTPSSTTTAESPPSRRPPRLAERHRRASTGRHRRGDYRRVVAGGVLVLLASSGLRLGLARLEADVASVLNAFSESQDGTVIHTVRGRAATGVSGRLPAYSGAQRRLVALSRFAAKTSATSSSGTPSARARQGRGRLSHEVRCRSVADRRRPGRARRDGAPVQQDRRPGYHPASRSSPESKNDERRRSWKASKSPLARRPAKSDAVHGDRLASPCRKASRRACRHMGLDPSPNRRTRTGGAKSFAVTYITKDGASAVLDHYRDQTRGRRSHRHRRRRQHRHAPRMQRRIDFSDAEKSIQGGIRRRQVCARRRTTRRSTSRCSRLSRPQQPHDSSPLGLTI